MRLSVLTLLLCCASAFCDEFHYEEIAPGDVQHLKQAILNANDREIRTSLSLSGTYVFGPTDVLPPVKATISMYSNNNNEVFRIKGESGTGPNQLLTIDPDGNLTIGKAEFTRFDIRRTNPTDPHIGIGPLITNRGILTFNEVVFREIDGVFFITRFTSTPPLIQNEGTLLASESSFINTGFNEGGGGLLHNLGFARFERVFFDSAIVRAPIFNGGDLELVNVSYQGNPFDGSGDSSPLQIGIGTVVAGNSIFAGVGHSWCSYVTSLGHNLTDNVACDLSGNGDIVGVATGMLPLSADPKMRELILSAASPAVDSGDPQLCATVPVGPIDGDGDGIAICDRGAFELIPKGLSDGGANGLYFDPDQDGHYVYVLDNDYNTLVMWNTFDTQGNQAWVLAVGDLANGRSMIADAYINEGGVLTPTGPANIGRDTFWGTIQIELDSCEEGTFYFDSQLPNFTGGQFTMRRLAFVTQIGCEN